MISDVFIPWINADRDDTKSRLRIGTKYELFSLEGTYLSKREKNELILVHPDLVSNPASPVKEAEKSHWPPHQLIEGRSIMKHVLKLVK